MRVLIQWAKATPEGWTEHEIARVQDWRALPSKNQPTSPDQPVDDNPGWINAVCIQGVFFNGYDGYSIQGMPGGGIQVWIWNDSADFPPGERHGAIWTFQDPAPDSAIGNRINTRQSRTLYAEPGSQVATALDATDPPVPYLPWSQFSTPAANAQRYGKWLADEKFTDHVQLIVPLPGWREWIT